MAHSDDDRDDGHDGPQGHPPAKEPDPDRAAILARRQRFIALALTGLTTTACDKPTTKPDACLKVKVSDPKEPKSSGDPQPCLDVAPPATSTSSGGGSSDGPDPDPATTAEPTPCLEVEPTPHPCLSPKPCLDVAPAPTPCLKVAPPRPCLKVAKPPPKKVKKRPKAIDLGPSVCLLVAPADPDPEAT